METWKFCDISLVLIDFLVIRLFKEVNSHKCLQLHMNSARSVFLQESHRLQTVNVCVYNLISPWVQMTSQFTIQSCYWNSLLYSLIFPMENSACAHFAATIANHYNLAFLFYQVPITAGWTEVAWYERLTWHLYTWLAAWLEHRSLIQVLTGLGIA